MQTEGKISKNEKTNPAIERMETRDREKQYFPVMLVSAPHIEETFPETPSGQELKSMPKWRQSLLKWKNQNAAALDYSMYPGEPTPLRYASAILEHQVRTGSFPNENTPEITAVLNPPVFNHQFVNQLIYRLTTDKPKILAISNLSESHPYALIIADMARQYSPDTVVIIGGKHETGTHPETDKEMKPGVPREKMEPLRTLYTEQEQKDIDFVVSGDGQYAFYELVRLVAQNPRASRDEIKRLAKSKLNPQEIQGTGFISFADPDNPVKAGKREIAEVKFHGKSVDYNALPYIGRDLLYAPNYYPVFLDEMGREKLTAQITLQHGCFESCSFCCEGMDAKEFINISRARLGEKYAGEVSGVRGEMSQRVQKVIEELRIVAQSGYKALFFDDSTFLQNDELIHAFLDAMIAEKQKGGFGFEWGCQTTLLSFDEEKAKKMRAAGCSYVYFGVENKYASKFKISKAKHGSYSYNPLQVVGQGDPAQRWVHMFEQATNICQKYGIRLGASLQFGFEGETAKDRKDTIDMMAEVSKKGILKTVALNINTTYPRTGDWISMLRTNQQAPDWRKPLTRHPMYETFTENSSLTNQQKIEKIKQILRIARSERGKSLLLSFGLQNGLSQESLDHSLKLVREYEGSIIAADEIKKRELTQELFNKLAELPEIKELIEFLALRKAFKIGDEIARYAKQELGSAVLSGVYFEDPSIQAIVNENRKAYSYDAYFPPKYLEYLERRQQDLPVPEVNFNNASMCPPFVEARKQAEEIFAMDRKGEFSPEQKTKIRNEARRIAAEMVSLPDPKGVVLCDNTSEAIGLSYWLAGLEDGSQQNVVTTNGENVSAWFTMQMHQDHGNKTGRHAYTTFPTFGVRQAKLDGGVIYEQLPDGRKVQEFDPIATGIELKKIEVLDSSKDQILEQLNSLIDKDTQMLMFSHIIRDNGRLLPVKEICDLARRVKAEKNPENPDLFIFVDGAQALGNLPQIDFNELGCDFYCANPHKTLGSEVVGLMFFDPNNPKIQANLQRLKNLNYRQQILRKGMFHPDLVRQFAPKSQDGEISNVPDEINIADTWGFIAAHQILVEQYGLQSNNFSELSAKRQGLKEKCAKEIKNLNVRLNSIGDIQVSLTEPDSPTPFILSFKVNGLKGDNLIVRPESATAHHLSKVNTLMQLLWEKGVFISLINRNSDNPDNHRFRVAFGAENTKKEVDEFIKRLEESIRQVTEFENQLL